jgi:hypothetical protein
VDPHGETYPAPHDANQAVNIKVSDAEEEEDPVPITFPKIKAEPEVSCLHCRQITQMCRSVACFLICISVHVKQLHCAVDRILEGFIL